MPFFNRASHISKYLLLLASLLIMQPLQAMQGENLGELLAAAEQLRSQGFLARAEMKLNQAKALVQPGDKAHNMIAGLQANLLAKQGQYDRAFLLLQNSLRIATRNQWPLLAGDHAYHLARLYELKDNPAQATRLYQIASAQSTTSGDTSRYFQSQLALLSLAWQDNPDTASTLDGIIELVALAQDSQDSINAQLELSKFSIDVLNKSSLPNNISDKLASESMLLLTNLNHSALDNRQSSQALGMLAQLHDYSGDYVNAKHAVQTAIMLAQQQQMFDRLYRLEWQHAQILAATNDLPGEVEALRRAVSHLESIRQDIPVIYTGGRSSFLETLEPLYLDLVDGLLQLAAAEQGESQQALLQEAQTTLELLKRSELEDYFSNRCSFESQQSLDFQGIAPDTAALYPIMLDSRLVLLLKLNGVIYQRQVAIGKEPLSRLATQYAQQLRTLSPKYQTLSDKLYSLIVTPILPLLRQHQVDTILYLPDAALRLVPLSSLVHDGRPLLQDFAIATSPGLSLFQLENTPGKTRNALLAGLSEPGPVVAAVGRDVFAALEIAGSSNLIQRMQTQARQQSITKQSGELRIRSKTPIARQAQTSTGQRRLSWQKRQKRENPPASGSNLPNPGQPGVLRIVNKYEATDKTRRLSMQRQLKRKNAQEFHSRHNNALRIVRKRPALGEHQIAAVPAQAGETNDSMRSDSKQTAIDPNQRLGLRARQNRTISGFEPVLVAKNQQGHLRIRNQYAGQMAQPQSSDNDVTIGVSKLPITEQPLRIRGKRPLYSVGTDEMTQWQLKRLKQRLSLPGVAREIAHLDDLYNAKTLNNEAFSKALFLQNMLQNRYDIVHVASHGVFGDSADNSFIMAHDALITMRELESLLSDDKFDRAPIELLTLSACQTAEGDDRAPLGISGIALRANVRSTLGALWAVSDAATVALMQRFYDNLAQGGFTKAEALRQAQRDMLKDPSYQHPFYWSAFILIGNWL